MDEFRPRRYFRSGGRYFKTAEAANAHSIHRDNLRTLEKYARERQKRYRAGNARAMKNKSWFKSKGRGEKQIMSHFRSSYNVGVNDSAKGYVYAFFLLIVGIIIFWFAAPWLLLGGIQNLGAAWTQPFVDFINSLNTVVDDAAAGVSNWWDSLMFEGFGNTDINNLFDGLNNWVNDAGTAISDFFSSWYIVPSP